MGCYQLFGRMVGTNKIPNSSNIESTSVALPQAIGGAWRNGPKGSRPLEGRTATRRIALLRSRRERPSRRAAKQREEVAPCRRT
jgi:hypothetical protein